MDPVGNKVKRISSVNHTTKQLIFLVLVLVLVLLLIIIIITFFSVSVVGFEQVNVMLTKEKISAGL